MKFFYIENDYRYSKVNILSKNRNTILKRSKDYYENNKEQRKQYRRDKYNNMTDEERLKVLAYRKNSIIK